MTDRSKKTDFKSFRDSSKAMAYYRRPNNFGVEGEDHINININSKTRLGMLFDPSYRKGLTYPFIGNFKSVSSLWYWIKSRTLDDRIRNLYGIKLMQFVRENKQALHPGVPNFRAIIGYATWLKVQSDPKALVHIQQLPPEIKLLSYHTLSSSKLRICSNYADVIIDVCAEIIDAVKQEREPQFDGFCNNHKHKRLHYLEGVLKMHLPAEQLQELLQNPPTA